MNIIKALPLFLMLAGCGDDIYEQGPPETRCDKAQIESKAKTVKEWMKKDINSHQLLRDEINTMVIPCGALTSIQLHKILLDLEKSNTFPFEATLGRTP